MHYSQPQYQLYLESIYCPYTWSGWCDQCDLRRAVLGLALTDMIVELVGVDCLTGWGGKAVITYKEARAQSISGTLTACRADSCYVYIYEGLFVLCVQQAPYVQSAWKSFRRSATPYLVYVAVHVIESSKSALNNQIGLSTSGRQRSGYMCWRDRSIDQVRRHRYSNITCR